MPVGDTAVEAVRAAQDAVWWAAASAAAAWILGLAGLVLNAGGLFFIWRQLKANERALDASSHSAEAASLAATAAIATSRPWIKLTVERAFINVNPDQAGHVGCQVDYLIENIGNSPALEVVPSFIPFGGGSNVDGLEVLKSAPDVFRRSARTMFPGDKVREGRSTNFEWPAEWILPYWGGSSFKVFAEVTYKSTPGGTVHRTPYFVQLQKEKPLRPDDHVFRPEIAGHYPCLVIFLGEESPGPT